MPCRKARAAAASSSSILERANPTWIRIQSPGWMFASSSRPMLMARRTPLTSTMARSARSAYSSTTSPGIPRHMGLHPLQSAVAGDVLPREEQDPTHQESDEHGDDQ